MNVHINVPRQLGSIATSSKIIINIIVIDTQKIIISQNFATLSAS